MKAKFYLLIVVGLLLLSNLATAIPPCGEGCEQLQPYNSTKLIIIGNCTIEVSYDIYYCEGPPIEYRISYNSFNFLIPVGDDCNNVDLNTLMPLAYDLIVKTDSRMTALTDDLEPGEIMTNPASTYNVACWQFDGATPGGGGGWLPCDLNSCCIRHYTVGRDFQGNIYTIPQYQVYATRCTDNPLCIKFCDE